MCRQNIYILRTVYGELIQKLKFPTGLIHPVGTNSDRSTLKPEIQFNSATSSKSSHKLNPFAEQNIKREEKRKLSDKRQKKIKTVLYIVISLLIVALIALLTIFLINVLNSSDDQTPTDEEMIFEPGKAEENIINLNDLATSAYQTENGDSSVYNKNLAAAESVFNEATKIPQNKNHLSQIYLSKMMFYINNGYYDLAVETIKKINPDDLETDQKTQFYSYASMSYYYVGNETEYIKYKELNQQVQNTLEGYGG